MTARGPACRGYVYLMRKNEQDTYRAIGRLRGTIINHDTFIKPATIDNNKYWGRMRFRTPLPYWDAMEGGLVPLFNCYKADNT